VEKRIIKFRKWERGYVSQVKREKAIVEHKGGSEKE